MVLGRRKKRRKKKKKGPVAVEDIKKDNFLEKKMRGDAGESAASWLYFAYDIYKKAHMMASATGEGFDTHDDDAVSEYAGGGDVSFGGSFRGAKSN